MQQNVDLANAYGANDTFSHKNLLNPGTLARRNIRPTTAASKTPAQSNYVKLQKRVRERNRS